MNFDSDSKKPKYRVAIICHLSNHRIQGYLPLRKASAPYAEWIENVLEGLKKYLDFEIHVIAPHDNLKHNISFNNNGIFYHFFKIGIPLINHHWPFFLDMDTITKNFVNNNRIYGLIDTIKPDLINLHGFENPKYSASVLKLHLKYPVLVTIQGFFSLNTFKPDNYVNLFKKHTELSIIRSCKFFCGDDDSKVLITKIRNNVDFKYYKFFYPVSSFTRNFPVTNEKKSIDILFWGRMDRDKGIEDFIRLVGKLRRIRSEIKACVIGPTTNSYLIKMIDYAKQQKCHDSIEFKGYIENQSDLYNSVLKCKILIVPTYNDRLPTVIREAMFLKIAVVAYDVGSIPQINENGENIKLIKVGDEMELTKVVNGMLNNSINTDKLIRDAHKFAEHTFNIDTCADNLVNIYLKIIEPKPN